MEKSIKHGPGSDSSQPKAQPASEKTHAGKSQGEAPSPLASGKGTTAQPQRAAHDKDAPVGREPKKP